MGKGKTITPAQVEVMNTLKDLNVPTDTIAQAMGVSRITVWRHTKDEAMVGAENDISKINDEIRELMKRKTVVNAELDKAAAERDEAFKRFGVLAAEKKKINEQLNKLYDLKKEMEER